MLPACHVCRSASARAHSNHLLLADDNMLLAHSVHQAQQLLDVLATWCKKWHLEVSIGKTVAMVFGNLAVLNQGMQTVSNLTFNNAKLSVVNEYTYLGVVFLSDCQWTKDQNTKVAKARACTAQLSHVLSNRHFPMQMQVSVWKAAVCPLLKYGMAFAEPPALKKIEAMLLSTMRSVLRCNSHTASAAVCGDIGIISMDYRRYKAQLAFLNKLKREPTTLAAKAWRAKPMHKLQRACTLIAAPVLPGQIADLPPGVPERTPGTHR